MGSSVVNVYVYCAEQGSSSPADAVKRAPEPRPDRQGIARFDRLRVFNGSKGIPSTKTLKEVSYTPKKTGSPDGTPVQLVTGTATIVDGSGLTHIPMGGADAEMRPDTIEFVFTPAAPIAPSLPAQSCILALTDQQILDGFYLRRVTFEVRAPAGQLMTVFAEYVFGKDDPNTGLPMPDFVQPVQGLLVTIP